MPHPLRPAEIFATLSEYHVSYVVIGGLAAVLHGSPTITADADICAERTPQNLRRLARALDALHARVRTAAEPSGVPFTPDATLLSRLRILNLTTDFGDLDLTFEPAGFAGFQELADHATVVSIGGAAVQIAALDDVIRSKELANRPKDHATLPILYALRDEIEQRRPRSQPVRRDPSSTRRGRAQSRTKSDKKPTSNRPTTSTPNPSHFEKRGGRPRGGGQEPPRRPDK